MKTLPLFLLLVIGVNAKINIEIIATDNRNDSQVLIYGNEDSVISDEESKTFQLSDSNLKQAFLKRNGTLPDDVFIKDPTKLGNIYAQFKWTQVSRTLKPINYTIISMHSAKKLAATKIFNNTSTKPAKFKAQIQTNVENTLVSQWHKYGRLTVNKTIGYNVEIAAMAVSGQAAFSYVSDWGQQVAKKETVTVGSKSSVEVNLEPGQELIAELYATTMSMKVKIVYEASLYGSVFANYEQLFENHHFYSVDISEVCSAGNLTCKVLSNEEIDLAYYTDSTVVLRDIDVKRAPNDFYSVIRL